MYGGGDVTGYGGTTMVKEGTSQDCQITLLVHIVH